MTPIDLDRFNDMCFVDNAPYSMKVFYDLYGLKHVKVDAWVAERNDARRKIYFTIPEASPALRLEVRVTGQQKYVFSKMGLTLVTKYSFKNDKYQDLDIETNLEIKPILSGMFHSMLTFKLFIYRND